MTFTALPPRAAWVHRQAREGFEVVFPRVEPTGHRLVGHTSAVEEGQAWYVGYEIEVDAGVAHAHGTRLVVLDRG